MEQENEPIIDGIALPGRDGPGGIAVAPVEGEAVIAGVEPERVLEEFYNLENNVFTFIINGTIDEDESKIDNETDLEKRKKYIYDIRYWAWKRLNAIIENEQKRVEWENVNAYFYRHSEDSIWSKMFSPPVFWSPVDTYGEVMSKVNKAGLFGKYDFGNSELTEANISIIRKIAKELSLDNTVLLYGFAVGGLVVQRICEIISVCVKNEKLSELILGVVLEEEKLKRFKVSTFGSIYIAPFERVRNIQIHNYMMYDDPITRTNFFDFGLGFLMPSFDDDDDGREKEKGFVYTSKHNRLYHYLKYEDSNIIYLKKWESSWGFWEKEEDINKNNFLQYSVGELKKLLSEHNPKYDLIFNKLLKSRTYSFAELPNNELEDAPEERVEEVPEEVPIPVAIVVAEPVNTVVDLVENVVTLTPEFYNEERDYISEAAREERINRKLAEIREAKRLYIEEEQRLLPTLDAAEVQARRRSGNSGVPPNIISRDIRMRNRNARNEMTEEINNLSNHVAQSYLHLHELQDKPIINAEYPEDGMLDFSIILGQLETKAVFLNEDGLRNLSRLVRDARTRAQQTKRRLERMAVAAAGAPAVAAAGGSGPTEGEKV